MTHKRILHSKLLDRYKIKHAFFTREDQIFPPQIGNLDHQGETSREVRAREAYFVESLGVATLALPRQVHSDRIWQAPEHSEFSVIRGPEADASISRSDKVAVGVVTADCVPVLLSLKNGKIVAAVHAGWRGLFSEILSASVEQVRKISGAGPEEIIAAVGPAIGQCCYAVDQELIKKFLEKFEWTKGYAQKKENAKFNLDLPGIAARQLHRLGIPSDNIDAIALCTKCNRERFHSFRRDRNKAARQVSAIAPGLVRD